MPFKYLGVPLSTNRVTIVQCQLLIDKIMGRIQNWTSRFLSGRVQLIRVCYSLFTCVLVTGVYLTKESDHMH